MTALIRATYVLAVAIFTVMMIGLARHDITLVARALLAGSVSAAVLGAAFGLVHLRREAVSQ